MRKVIAILAGLVVLGAANYGIYTRELLLTDGRTVLLQLAPVDPRSLMQGDYMALDFAVTGEPFGRPPPAEMPRDGHIVLGLDDRHIGRFVRFDGGQPLTANEVRMRYRIRHGHPRLATNAWFFQEGEENVYARAQFGEFRVDADGDAILVAMRDAEAQRLGRALPGVD